MVVGEGERTFPELVKAWERGLAPDSVSGLAYRSDGKFTFTGERDLIDIDTMPTANRALTKEYRNSYFRGSWRPTGSVIFSRGCPFRCEFCAEWKINKGKYRVRDPKAVMREIAGMEEYYIHFIDDNTFENVGKARELAECIKAEGVKKKYEVYGRSDTIVKHPELIERWREIGLELVLIGLEAIDQNKLKSWNKRISPSVNDEAITILHKNGIEIAAYFIIDPDFGREDFDALLSYIEKRQLTHPIFTVLSPFPGTELRERRRKELLTDSYQILDFFHTDLPTRLPLEEFYDNFSDLYLKE
ncbi:MAG: radical SAM protein [bacterium]